MPTIDNRLPTEGTQQDILNAILQIVSTLTVDDNGHVIVNDSGTFLAQRNNLKIGGVYTEDVSGDDTTVANVIRKMTKEQLLSLQGEAKKGIQITTDEPSVLPLTTDWVEAKGGNTSTQLLDNMNNSIAPAEYGTKSVSDYSRNDVFMLNGTRVVATSAISQGDTFVVYPATGYNCQPQTVEEKFESLATVATSGSGNDVIYSGTTSVNTAIYNTANKVTTLTPSRRTDITNDDTMKALPNNSTLLAYMGSYTNAPFSNIWVTIRTFGDNVVKNQEVVCANGYAFRHYEGGTWGAWKKVNFS